MREKFENRPVCRYKTVHFVYVFDVRATTVFRVIRVMFGCANRWLMTNNEIK